MSIINKIKGLFGSKKSLKEKEELPNYIKQIYHNTLIKKGYQWFNRDEFRKINNLQTHSTGVYFQGLKKYGLVKCHRVKTDRRHYSYKLLPF